MSTYAWIDFLSVLFPVLFSFHPSLKFYRNWPATAVAILAMMGLFVPWDAFFSAQGVWGFADEHTWPIRLFGLPLEELGFFVCIPYACLFTYHCFGVQLKSDPFAPYARAISIAIALLLVPIALFNLQRAYTSSTFLLCPAMVLFVAFVMRPRWLGRFYFTFLVLLIPFLIVNGLLTGTGIPGEVVHYNNEENLGIRVLTIPVEDVFYGLLMQLMVVTFYELVQARWPSRTSTA
ncbi:MAG: lycopene cyclase domain-containing protein [Flavobacteriales bacterium]